MHKSSPFCYFWLSGIRCSVRLIPVNVKQMDGPMIFLYVKVNVKLIYKCIKYLKYIRFFEMPYIKISFKSIVKYFLLKLLLQFLIQYRMDICTFYYYIFCVSITKYGYSACDLIIKILEIRKSKTCFSFLLDSSYQK